MSRGCMDRLSEQGSLIPGKGRRPAGTDEEEITVVIHEELLWILDAKEEDYGSWDEDRARRNIEFVHSMGR